jgi:hypothetical protein
MLKCFHAALSIVSRFIAMIFLLWLGPTQAHAQEVIMLPTYYEITQQNTTIGSVALDRDLLYDKTIVTLIDGQIQYNLQNATDPKSSYVFNYLGVEFSVTQAGTYYLGQSKAPTDTLMLLYKDSFDAKNITQNLIAANDDWYRFRDASNKSMSAYNVGDDCVSIQDNYFSQYRCVNLPGHILKLDKCGAGARNCPGLFATLDVGKYVIIITTFRSSDSSGLSLPETFWCYGGACTFTKTIAPPKTEDPKPVDPAPPAEPKPADPQPPAEQPQPTDPAKPTDSTQTDKNTPDNTTTTNNTTTTPSTKGPSPLFTLLSVYEGGSALHRLMAQRLSLLANVTEFDCTSFSRDGYCVSFRLRSSTTSSQSEGGGLMTLAYRATSHIRAGLITDLTVTPRDQNGFQFRDERPTVGAFLIYGSPEHRGFGAKLSGAWQTSVIRYTRGNYFETEPGSGKAVIAGYSGRAEISYGFAPRAQIRLTPFMAFRRTILGRGGYREDETGTVKTPLTYLPFNLHTSTAIAGLRAAAMVTEQFGIMFAISVERDLVRRRSDITASSSSPDIPTIDLPFGRAKLNPYFSVNLGFSWEVAPKQYLTAQANLRAQPGLATPSVTTLLGYQVSF